jgi:hypothetical protein
MRNHPATFALLTVALTACGDSRPLAIPAPTGPSLNQGSDCFVSEVQLSPSGNQILQASNGAYQAIAIGRRRDNAGGCSFPGNVSFSWSVSPASLAQVGQTYSSWGNGYADIYGAAPGNITIIVSATTPALSGAPTRADTVTATVVARTATPAVGAINGPATVSASGNYTYTISASGGNGSTYNYVWETRHSGLGWTTVHTASGGSTSSASIPLVGGRLYSVRVRVTSGTSLEATSAEYAVDATGAAAPVGVTLSGSDNIRTTGVHTFEAMPTGGTGTYTYLWTLTRPDNSTRQGTGKTFDILFPTCEGPEWYTLDVVVTSGSQTGDYSTILNVEIYGC